MVVTDFIMFPFIAAVGLILCQVLKTIVVSQMASKAGQGERDRVIALAKIFSRLGSDKGKERISSLFSFRKRNFPGQSSFLEFL